MEDIDSEATKTVIYVKRKINFENLALKENIFILTLLRIRNLVNIKCLGNIPHILPLVFRTGQYLPFMTWRKVLYYRESFERLAGDICGTKFLKILQTYVIHSFAVLFTFV